jgi:molecular chaperone GrpE
MTEEQKKPQAADAETKELQEKLEKTEKEREEYLNGWKRVKADFINYQKDEAKRFKEIIDFSNQELIKDIIPVLDSFDLGISALEKEGKVEKGVYIIRTQLENVLKKRGLEKMIVSIGQKFDPALHEAISGIESSQPSGTIIEEVEKGYLLNGRVIRPARVRVAK